MSDSAVKHRIEEAIKDFGSGNLAERAIALFGNLGYRSDKRVPGIPSTREAFVQTYPGSKPLNEKNALFDQWESADILFQLTDAEVAHAAQTTLFESERRVDNRIIQSYVFVAISLRGNSYTRTDLAGVTREVNKLFQMPALLLFRHGATLTLAVIDRRPHKREEQKDVLEKVTLIKDIRFANPHRAHTDILFDLSLDQLRQQYEINNWVQLHDAWRKTLNTSELNKKFFREIRNWYFWARKCVKFPKGAIKDDEGLDSLSVIRLLTRLVFVWFIKEKGLVPDVLFERTRLESLLKWNDPTGTNYYKAILQNLFFATLNTKMNKDETGSRGFAQTRRLTDDYLTHNKFRYQELLNNPDELLHLCENIPFLNGGLFECLDREVNKQELASSPDIVPRITREGEHLVLRVDGFSRRSDNEIVVPDSLFFARELPIDLNEIYGTKNKGYTVCGLIETFGRYKFTVDENTPIEEEIALDPELLGKVFENLLAAYNPETGATARKQTGSFYTPREIVDYMVDESLVAYLETQLKTKVPSLAEMKDLQEFLREVLAYTEKTHPFDSAEAIALVDSIDALKVLDPACGSGAFPMGMLHKLVFVLRKLDPDGGHWKHLQMERAKALENAEEYASELTDIEQVFANGPDYARKLYLIENCLYGVDIQPIAVQIAKLRCFISLIVDDQADDAKHNRGIRPLPNLETRFVAANALIGIERPQMDHPVQLGFVDSFVENKRKELERVRRQHFAAHTHKAKTKSREDDARLRGEVAAHLQGNSGWPDDVAKKVACWDPYDQSAYAKFFDPEWMFGVSGGFDLVISNPPYGLLNKRQNKAEAILVQPNELAYYKTAPQYSPTASGMINIYRLFILKSISLLCDSGVFIEIFPLAFIADISASGLRKHILNSCAIRSIEAFPERDDERRRVFEAAKMSVCILHLRKSRADDSPFFVRIHRDKFVDHANEKAWFNREMIGLFDTTNYSIPLVTQEEADLVTKIFARSVTISKLGHCYTGEIDLTLGSAYLTDDPNKAVLIKGAIIDKYRIRKEMSQGEIKFLDHGKYLSNNGGNKSSHFKMPRIVMQGITGVNEHNRLKMTLIDRGIFCANSVNYIVFNSPNIDILFMLGLLNSSLMNFIFSRFSTNSNVNGYEVDNLPFPKHQSSDIQRQISSLAGRILREKQGQMTGLVDRIPTARSADPDADTSAMEREIDALVYKLYGLTEEEMALVEKDIKAKK